MPPDQNAVVAGSPVARNFIAPLVTGAIAGTVKDGPGPNDAPITGVHVSATATLGGIDYVVTATTHSGGGYSLPVFASSWNVGVSTSDLTAQNSISPPNQGAPVTTGTVTRNFVAPHATATIAGAILDTQNTAIGSVHVSAVATLGGVIYTVSAMSDGNGNYSLAVFPGTWIVSVSGDDLQAQGFLGIPDQGAVVNSGTFTLNFSAPHATSIIHGTVMTPSSTPAAFVQVTANEVGGSGTLASATTNANGDYSLGVNTGSWDVGASDTPGFIPERQNVSVSNPGDSVLQNLVIHPITVHLRGQVRDNQSNPVPNLPIVAHDSNVINTSVNATTDGNGNFDIGVYGGEGVTANKDWALQVLLGAGVPANYVSSDASFVVSDGVDIDGITYLVYIVTAHLRGQVLDENDQTVGNIAVYARGKTYSASSGGEVDAFGFFDVPVIGGNWSLGLSNVQGLGLISQVFPVAVTDGFDQNDLEFHARHTTGIIMGLVEDGLNSGVEGVQVLGQASHDGIDYATFVTTNSQGQYSMPVFSETWSVGFTDADGFSAADLLARGYQVPPNQSAFAGAGTVTINFNLGLSSDAGLDSLNLDSGALVPNFLSATTDYTVTVSDATTSLSVTPTLRNEFGSVKVNNVPVVSGHSSNPVSLNVGTNVITVLVTAQDGTTTKTYSITVTRQ
jgi:hypothetical protein